MMSLFPTAVAVCPVRPVGLVPDVIGFVQVLVTRRGSEYGQMGNREQVQNRIESLPVSNTQTSSNSPAEFDPPNRIILVPKAVSECPRREEGDGPRDGFETWIQNNLSGQQWRNEDEGSCDMSKVLCP